MPRTNQQSSIHLTWNPKADYWNAGTMLALCSGPISTVNPSMICPFANESSRLFLFFVSHFSTLSFSLLLKNDCFDSLPCCVPSGRRNIIFASSVHWSLNFTQLKSSDNFRNSASERPACRHKQSQQFKSTGIYKKAHHFISFSSCNSLFRQDQFWCMDVDNLIKLEPPNMFHVSLPLQQ